MCARNPGTALERKPTDGEFTEVTGTSAVPSEHMAEDNSSALPPLFDPLSKTNLARSVEGALLRQVPSKLAALPRFLGAGIYAIYYTGPLDIYASISSEECLTPIYVGKAEPAGGRKGLTSATGGTPLWSRLADHAKSVGQAMNLDDLDFRCRYLVADDLFTPLAEQLMIREYQPVWNVALDGFGNHDPGAGRRNQARSPWDVVHPGRPWAELQPDPGPDALALHLERVRVHLNQ